jgi:hypothetical protein
MIIFIRSEILKNAWFYRENVWNKWIFSYRNIPSCSKLNIPKFNYVNKLHFTLRGNILIFKKWSCIRDFHFVPYRLKEILFAIGNYCRGILIILLLEFITALEDFIIQFFFQKFLAARFFKRLVKFYGIRGHKTVFKKNTHGISVLFQIN